MTKIEHEEYHKTTITIGNKDLKEPIIVQLPKIKGRILKKIFKVKTNDKKVKEVTEVIDHELC